MNDREEITLLQMKASSVQSTVRDLKSLPDHTRQTTRTIIDLENQYRQLRRQISDRQYAHFMDTPLC